MTNVNNFPSTDADFIAEGGAECYTWNLVSLNFRTIKERHVEANGFCLGSRGG